MARKRRKSSAQNLEPKSQLINNAIASIDNTENSSFVIEELPQVIEELSKKVTQTYSQDNSLISIKDYNSLQKQITELKAQNEQHIKDYQALQKEADEKEKKIKDLQEKLAKQKARIEEFDNDTIQKQIDKKKQQIVELQQKLEKQVEAYGELQQKLEKKKKKISELEQQLEKQKLQIDEQAKTNQTLQQKLHQSEREITTLQNRLIQLTRQIDEQQKNSEAKEKTYQQQIAQKNSLEAIATSHLNKWRKNHFFS